VKSIANLNKSNPKRRNGSRMGNEPHARHSSVTCSPHLSSDTSSIYNINDIFNLSINGLLVRFSSSSDFPRFRACSLRERPSPSTTPHATPSFAFIRLRNIAIILIIDGVSLDLRTGPVEGDSCPPSRSTFFISTKALQIHFLFVILMYQLIVITIIPLILSF